jgi:hypothetical protein
VKLVCDKAPKKLIEAIGWSTHTYANRSRFFEALERWYESFYSGECSLGYAAEQLGLNKVDLIQMLDELGWPASNM